METILKRPDGSRVKIVARITGRYYSEIGFDVIVYVCKPGKRTWESLIDENDFGYRRLSLDNREKMLKQKQLEIVTPQEIYEAKLKLWESFKPTL